MDSAITAALIGGGATVLSAIITAFYGHRTRSTAPKPRLGLIVTVVILALGVGGALALLTYDGTNHRIDQALGSRSGFRKVIYGRVGIGFLVPNAWRVDDVSFRFGSGDIDLIRDYDPDAASISQGIKCRFLNVQENYVNNPDAEYGNEKEVLLKIDPRVSDIDISLGGLRGKKFEYQQSTGLRTAFIQRIWIHLTPRVKLEILSASNLDEASRAAFNAERDEIYQSFVIDQKKISKLAER